MILSHGEEKGLIVKDPYMDMYHISKETFLAWKGGGEGFKKHLLYWLEYQSVILDACQWHTNFAVQDHDVSLMFWDVHRP